MPNEQPYRRHNSLRHPHYDYRNAGAYFVTICVSHNVCLFGAIVGGVMQRNPLGDIACAAWPGLEQHHPGLYLDMFVVMPNHVHALLWLPPTDLPSVECMPQRTFGHRDPGSLSAIVGGYKSSVTQQARRRRLLPAPVLWHRNFYDTIVRNEDALAHIRRYICENPERWHDDLLHPTAPANRFRPD